MENPMKDRVIARLAELGVRPSELSIRKQLADARLHETYLNEFVTGKKKTISLKNIPAIAKILGMTAEELSGQAAKSTAGLLVAGVCEAGAWRMPGQIGADRLPFNPVPKYPAADQVAYLVRDRHGEKHGVSEGSALIVVRNLPPRRGDFVVVTRKRADGAQETTLQELVADLGNVTVEGVVILAVKAF